MSHWEKRLRRARSWTGGSRPTGSARLSAASRKVRRRREVVVTAQLPHSETTAAPADLIELLGRLRQGSRDSIVTEDDLTDFQAALYVHDRIEDWVEQRI